MMKKRPMTRSENMARVKSRNTEPEIYFRKLLWRHGIRYRVNYKDLPGKPDIYISKYKTAVFINGCFWHMHRGCKLSTIPKTRSEFWETKLRKNVERDKTVYEELRKSGIKVVVIWGCEIKKALKDSKIEDTLLQRVKTHIWGDCGRKA